MTAIAVEHRMPRAAAPAPRLAWLRERGMGASILVAAISSGFGVLLIAAVQFLSVMISADDGVGGRAETQLSLSIVGGLILGVAVYVAAIVTSNTFATVVAGRTREIALMRLIGASARSERERISRRGIGVGAVGALIGFVAGCVLAAAIALALPLLYTDGPDTYPLFAPAYVLPVVIVALTTWVAAWAGSRAVLAVTPLQALGGSVPRTSEQLQGRRRGGAAIALTASGVLALAGGVVVGLVSPVGLVIAFFGGVLSFTGIALGATLFLPPVLGAVGALFGRGVAARLAAGNAQRHPERASRMAMGLVIGITLVVMFAVASESSKAALVSASGGEGLHPALASAFDILSTIMMALMGVSAVIASVGLVNLLTLGIVQRRRELGLLRALGISRRQITAMVLLEAAHIALASVILGVALGVVYGWVAAQSMFGSVVGMNAAIGFTFVLPAVPWVLVVGIALAGAVLALVASVTPVRLATRVTPVEALAE